MCSTDSIIQFERGSQPWRMRIVSVVSLTSVTASDLPPATVIMAEAILRATSRRNDEYGARARAVEVWERYADDSDTVAPGDLAAMLRDLDYNRRTLSIGRGLSKSGISVAALPSDAVFALQELGITDVDLRSGVRVSRRRFVDWYVFDGSFLVKTNSETSNDLTAGMSATLWANQATRRIPC